MGRESCNAKDSISKVSRHLEEVAVALESLVFIQILMTQIFSAGFIWRLTLHILVNGEHLSTGFIRKRNLINGELFQVEMFSLAEVHQTERTRSQAVEEAER